jgi:hypothetical protein
VYQASGRVAPRITARQTDERGRPLSILAARRQRGKVEHRDRGPEYFKRTVSFWLVIQATRPCRLDWLVSDSGRTPGFGSVFVWHLRSRIDLDIHYPSEAVRWVAHQARRPASRPSERVNHAVQGSGAAQESNLPTVGLPRPAGFEDRMGHRARATPWSIHADDASRQAVSETLAGHRPTGAKTA